MATGLAYAKGMSTRHLLTDYSIFEGIDRVFTRCQIFLFATVPLHAFRGLIQLTCIALPL